MLLLHALPYGNLGALTPGVLKVLGALPCPSPFVSRGAGALFKISTHERAVGLAAATTIGERDVVIPLSAVCR